MNKKKIIQSQEERPVDHVNILEVRESKDRVHLRVTFSGEFYNELHQFLEQKGYLFLGREKEGISLLLELGLSEESHDELERNKNEMAKESSRYAAMSFQTSEYYARNSAIAMGLRIHLEKNRSLKQKLKELGLGSYVSEDDWDNWDDNFIEELYRRYVFCK